ncbi:MAG: hypothetical protein IKU51_01205 [Clostridia bacterium]|nr:hypothetical protein [Clostridia bacterium]
MKTISFFSYKGGAGRSTLAYNLIPILASEHFHPTAEHPMIVVDTDVDSCGMSYLVKAEDKVTETNCIQHLLDNDFINKRYASIYDHPFLKNLIPVGNAFGCADDRAILLLPAMDNKNIHKGRSNYSEAAGEDFGAHMENILKACEEYFDVPAVIFDSAVGNTAMANISNEMADIIVCVMRPTIQFVNGTQRYLADVESGKKSIGTGKHIILVPNVIPNNEITIGRAQYPATAIDKICDTFISYPKFVNSKKNTYHMDLLSRNPAQCGIPMVASFLYVEGQLMQKRLNNEPFNENETEVFERYKKLAGIINDIDLDA